MEPSIQVAELTRAGPAVPIEGRPANDSDRQVDMSKTLVADMAHQPIVNRMQV